MRGPDPDRHPRRTGRCRCGQSLCQRGTQAGFTLIEVLVVIAVIGILMAISAPGFHGMPIENADSKAQAIAKAAATQIQDIFADTRSYDTIEPTQLGCVTASSGSCTTAPNGNCPAPVTWTANGIDWSDSGTKQPSPVSPSPNGTEKFADGCGNNTAYVAAVLSWDNAGTGPNYYDTATTVAVSAPAPANDCWFITLHADGPPVYGFFESNSGCEKLTTNWPEATSPYNTNADGSWYNPTGTTAPIANSFPTTGFPPDPQV